jgi:hypothetical protein
VTDSNMAQSSFISGQRFAFASMAVVVGLLAFVNLAGIEKAVLAIVLGVKALSVSPQPALIERRGWARAGAILGGIQLTLLAGVIAFNFHRIGRVIEVLRALSDLR